MPSTRSTNELESGSFVDQQCSTVASLADASRPAESKGMALISEYATVGRFFRAPRGADTPNECSIPQ